MSKKTKVIFPVAFLVFSVFLFSGCFGEKADNSGAIKSSPAPKASSKADKNTEKQELPKATGNVDDASDAILDSVNKEGSLISEEEADAVSSVSEDQEIDDLSNSYDENEL